MANGQVLGPKDGADFTGKAVVVTGSAGGIGWEILKQFVARGARGVMSDIDEEMGRPRAEAMGKRVTFCKADVRDEAQVNALVEHCVAEHGRLDVWVNNAGVGVHTLAVDTTLEDFELQVDVQLIGAFLGARAAARQMIAQGGGGRVINIGSSAANNARKGAASHCSAKAGGAMLSKVLALEWGEHNITVNMVSPGLTNSWPTTRYEGPSEEYRRNFLRMVPAGRLGKPEEIAAACVFLATDGAAFITGHEIVVDGGYGAGKLSVHADTIME